jgi:hypothetical protein
MRKRIRKDLEAKAASNQNQYWQLIQPDVTADFAQLTHFPFITLTKVGCALC